jgi:FixJ family two-component response regulator
LKAVATVFVIDDDPGMRRALERLFRSAGREIEAFASAREFLARMPCAGAGCVVLDVNMPEMSGPELQERMAEQGIGLPVVFLTGHGDVPASVRAMKHGAVDYLTKPAHDETLLRAVEEAIARHAADHAQRNARQAVAARLALLSGREREVLQHVIRGRLNKQIAADLQIALKTVKVHRGRVMEKMGCASVADLVRAWRLAGGDAPQ